MVYGDRGCVVVGYGAVCAQWWAAAAIGGYWWAAVVMGR